MTATEPRAPAADPLVAELAAQLGETEATPLRQIRRAVATLGEERVRSFVAEALAVEARGGMMLPDGSRRRTPGGVFFHLVRQGVTRDERRAIFPHAAGGQRGRSAAPAIAEIAAQLGETAPAALQQLARALATLGEERVRAFVAEALAIEARGGMLLPGGSRRRTPGEVFAHLAWQGTTQRERRAIFRHAGPARKLAEYAPDGSAAHVLPEAINRHNREG